MDPEINNTDYSSYYPYGTLDPDLPVDFTPTTQHPANILALIIFLAVFLVGVPGNALVVWVTAFEAKRVINAIWFLNLAMADLLSCLALPILFASLVRNNDWPFGQAACKILPSLILFNMYASILLLATISADRFVLVFNPIWCQNFRGAGMAWVACMVAWGLALLLTIPSFLYRVVHVEYFPPQLICGVDYGMNSRRKEKAVAIVRLALGFLWPLVTLTVCYTFLLIRTWRRKATRSTKTLKVVVAIVASFFVCWLPYQVSGMILAWNDQFSPIFRKMIKLDALFVSFAYINCCINPVIYVVAGQGFHGRFLRSLPSMLRNVLTEDTLGRDSKSVTRSTVDTVPQKSQDV